MPEVSPKVSMSVNLIALLVMVIGGSVAYGKLQANIEYHANSVDRLNKTIEHRSAQINELQVMNARRDEQLSAIQRDVSYLRQSIDKISDRLEKKP